MPAPLAAAAVPLLTKAGAFLKGLSGVGTLSKLAGKGAALKSSVGSLGSRMAGGKFMANAKAMMPKTAGEWGARAANDLIFGGLAGVMTPGDLGDKLIAGTTATAGGVLGGLASRGLVGGVAPGLLKNGIVDMTTETAGGIVGDMAAQGFADSMLRIKGGGTTPYEKMAAEQQRQLEQDILRRYLRGKGGYPGQDQFLAENGLG